MLLASILLQGCAAGPFRLQYLWQHDDGLKYYVDRASAIEYPVEPTCIPANPDLFSAPRNIRSLDDVEPREVTLNECLQMALSKGTVLRDASSLGSPGNPILARPASAPSTLDPAIQSTGFLFGNRGYEAALADFDALATSNLTWGRNAVPQNLGNIGINAGQILTQETFSWQSRLEKTFANGGTFSLQSDTNYEGNNRGTVQQLFPSSYTGTMTGEYRQPLLAGAGTEFTRIAGPLGQSLRGVSGVSQGVLISRINGDISLTQFEQSVSTTIRDVEREYWDLNLALRLYESEREAFTDLVVAYDKLKRRQEAGDAVLQAESRIYEADARIKGSLADVLDKEVRLRRLCNQPLSDGTFLYPTDNPSEAELSPLWDAALQEALANRVELRRQKWEIKSLELQLKAARSLTRPRMDGVMQYRVNALGDQFGFSDKFQYDTLVGDYADGGATGWSAGVQWSMPIGLRLAHTQVRNYELRLRKARVMLQAQEWEVAYELAGSLLEMQRWYELADSTTRRIDSASNYALIVEERLLGAGNREMTPDLINLFLQAKIQERDAKQGYMRSIIEYNKAIVEMKFRKGTNLVENEIYLAEGNWNPAAAPFAMQRAVARTHAKEKHKLRTEPMEFVSGFAPVAWESLGTNTRPTNPGQAPKVGGNGSGRAVQQSPVDATPSDSDAPPPPSDNPAAEPAPAAEPIEPNPVPPALDPEPVPKPQTREIITQKNSRPLLFVPPQALAPNASNADTPERATR
ncbi:MAG: TolC family protein [Planctomycetaceae bacterium]